MWHQLYFCDQISPTLLTQGAVWSWAPNEPSYVSKPGTSDGCVFASKIDARWSSLDPATCISEIYVLPLACVNNADAFDWTLSEESTTGAAASSDFCPQGFSFAVPTNSRYNSILNSVLLTRFATNSTVEGVWINFRPVSL